VLWVNPWTIFQKKKCDFKIWRLFFFFFWGARKFFCTIGTELFLNRHSAKIRQNKNKNTACSRSPPPHFFILIYFSISKWLNFAKPKINTASRAAKERRRRRRRGRRVWRFVFWWENLISCDVLLNPIGIFAEVVWFGSRRLSNRVFKRNFCAEENWA
jgi:hypothetical protein